MTPEGRPDASQERYYSGVSSRQTTRCCSAIALVLLWQCATAAQKPATELSLLPLRPLWTLALNNALSAPPAFAGTRAYFPIEDDRLVAYDLATGHQLWLVAAAV